MFSGLLVTCAPVIICIISVLNLEKEAKKCNNKKN